MCGIGGIGLCRICLNLEPSYGCHFRYQFWTLGLGLVGLIELGFLCHLKALDSVRSCGSFSGSQVGSCVLISLGSGA